jgi:para-nitrobenzyl esterase
MRTISALGAAVVLGACAHGAGGGGRTVTLGDVVRVDAGTLRGVVADGVASFKGVPYAAPPVGALRWRAPQPVAPWQGARAADKVGALCVQKYNAQDKGVGPLPASEDCLTLNVWAPAGTRAGTLPVMFWIHGGGYVNGSGTAKLYDGTELAKQGAVVVTINYRLGRFGFFAHPSLTRENADGGLLGNYALMDQIAALRWVQKNAAAFGGDPGNVTIFGESAGGSAVTHLMISPLARGLFHKAISESGLGRERATYLSLSGPNGMLSSEAEGKRFAESLGVSADDPAALRTIPAERILAAGDPDLFQGGFPMIDGKVITADVADAFAHGQEAKVPFVVGYNSAEFPWATPGTPFFDGAVRALGDRRASLEAAYGADFATNIVSDLLFVEPARNLARLHARNGYPTYLYRFSVLSPTAPAMFKGAPHASERQYVFRTLGESDWPTNAADAAAAEAMSAYWVQFARGGNPNGGGRPDWPAFGGASERLLEFTNAGPVVGPVPLRERLDLISAFHESMASR